MTGTVVRLELSREQRDHLLGLVDRLSAASMRVGFHPGDESVFDERRAAYAALLDYVVVGSS